MKRKNFLKKLTAGILGFVMTLGVGAAGYAGAVGETHAANASIELCTSWNKTLAYATAYTQDYTIDNLTGGTTTMTLGVQGVYRQSNANTYFQMNKKSGYFKNTTKMPGKITKIETTWSATKGATKCYFAANGAATSEDETVTVSAATSVTYNAPTDGDYYYFNIDPNTGSGAAQMTSCKVFYESAGSTKTLSSIAVSGNPDTTNYKNGQSFDPSGLVVTGTYDDGSSAAIDSGIEWLFDPETLSTGDTSVDVMASVGSITSDVYTVYGLTVVNAPLEYSHKYTYSEMGTGSGKTWNVTNSSNQSNYWLVPTGNDPSVVTIPGIFANKVITSDVVITIDHATYGNGTNPSSSTFGIYSDSTCSSSVTSAFSGSTATSSTYADAIYTVASTNTSSFGDDLFIKITKPGKQIRLRNITVEFEYSVAVTHTVTYLGNGNTGGSEPKQSPVAEGKTFTVAANTFIKTGNTFSGWKDQAGVPYSPNATYTMGTSDVTLTAQWSPISYTLAYNANGGEGTVTGGTYEYNSEVTLSSSTFTMEGYTQNGWSNSSGLNNTKDYAGDGSGKLTMPASNKTVYAHWEANEYTITYNANGGEGTVSSQTADYKSSVTLAASGFTMAHKNLDGWATSADGAVSYQLGASITMPLNGLQLYAHYSLQSHTVLYNGNGGEAEIESDTVIYGEDVNLKVDATYPGFTLQGWALTSDASVGLDSLTMGDENITLYAVWKEDERTYAFNAYANDGVSTEPIKVGDYHNGEEITMPYFEDLGISRSGYTALGWATSPTGSKEYDEGETLTMGNSALNVYAVWQKHLDGKPTLSLSGSSSMWVGKSQTLTINYTAGAETLEVSASPSGVVSLAQVSDVSGVRTYTVSAVGEGTATITAGDSFYSDSVSITATADYLDSVTIAGSLPSGTYYEGDSLSIATAISNLTIAGQMKSGDSVTIPKNAATWTFADGSSSVKLASGMTKVTVVAVYNEVESNELDLAITVTPVTMESLTVNYTGGQPILGTTFSFAGSITANMSNGTHPTVNLSDVEIGAVDRFTLNQQTITVTHKTTGATGTFNVQYKVKQIETQASWQKVSSISAGDVITFVYEGTDAASYAVGWKKDDHTLSSNTMLVNMDGSVTTSGNVTTLNLATDSETSKVINPYELTVVDTSSTLEGTYAFKDGNYYVVASAANKSSNDLASTSGDPTASNQKCWSVTFSGSTPTIKTETGTSGTWRYIKYNKGSGQERFSGYTGGQEAIAIYKKVETPIGQPSVIKIDASLKEGKTFNEGATISPSDFDVSALYDTGTTGGVTATSVSPTTLGPGNNTITVNYNSFSDTVVVTAAEIAHLDHISVVDGTGQRSFERLDEFDYTGLEVMAYYSNTDKTKFPDHKVNNFTVDPSDVDMSETGTYTVGVSYKENGVTKTTSYNITVTPKTSTYVTIEGDGIEGSAGSYTLTSPIQNTVDLTIGHDGDEEITFSTESSFLSYSNGQLVINSSTTTTETGTITFSAGSASATLTVTVTASETIQLISDEHVSGFIGDELEVNIALGNVESATWTLPSASDGFTIKTTSKDNTGFVGTISVSEECVNKEAVFSVVTGKGQTLTVSVYVSAQVDAIDSISATCSKTYVAGEDTFSPSDLTVTYERLSGATGTLSSNEFTVTGAPTGKLARGSYDLTITSNEGGKTATCTISASMPTGLNVVTAHTEEIPGQTTVSWSKLTSKSQLDANEKIYIYADDIGYVTGYSGKDATVSETSSDRIEFTVEITDATNGKFKLSDPTTQKYITYYTGNQFGITESQANGATFSINSDGHFQYNNSSSSSSNRYLCANGTYYRCYESIGKYTPFDLYISKTTTGEPTTKTTYTNHESMSETMFDFINRWGGTELTAGNWGDIFDSDEYKALTATDKEWFKTGVVADDEGTMESCELFADFITKYDQILAMNSELVNYLDRDKLNLSAFINASIGFQFTGLEMKKFEFVFTGEWTTEEKVSSYGFMISKNLDTLNECIESKSTTGSGVTTFVPKDGEAKCSAGVKTTSADTIYYAVFFYEDANGIHYSLVLEISINGYLLSDQFDINSITDPYAKAAIQAWISSLEK